MSQPLPDNFEGDDEVGTYYKNSSLTDNTTDYGSETI